MDDAGIKVEQRVVDARGHCCPIPTLRLRRALQDAAAGDILVLLATDPMARIDVPHFVAQAGHAMLASAAESAGEWRFTVRKRASTADVDRAARPA